MVPPCLPKALESPACPSQRETGLPRSAIKGHKINCCLLLLFPASNITGLPGEGCTKQHLLGALRRHRSCSEPGRAHQLRPLGNTNTNTLSHKHPSGHLLPSRAVCRSSGPPLLGLGAQTPNQWLNIALMYFIRTVVMLSHSRASSLRFSLVTLPSRSTNPLPRPRGSLCRNKSTVLCVLELMSPLAIFSSHLPKDLQENG